MARAQKNRSAKKGTAPSLEIGATVRRLRDARNLSGVELCRRGKGIDPKTLTALEKGRIKNPSIATLGALAKGFGMTVSDLFRQAEIEHENYFSRGSQKGLYKIDFPAQGIQLISFTPLSAELFCGKMIVEGQKRFDEKLLECSGAFFLMPLIGQFEGEIEGRRAVLKEGENLFFYGGMKFFLKNSFQRYSTLLLVAAPSCFQARPRLCWQRCP